MRTTVLEARLWPRLPATARRSPANSRAKQGSRLRSKLIAVGILVLVAGASSAAEAAECRWFGTAPLCEGECPSGWKAKNHKQCFSGWKVYCCAPEQPCKYGDPGCPFPPFGGAPGSDGKAPPSGPQPPPDVIKGHQQESGSGSGVLVPEQSQGPSPFGSHSPPNQEEEDAWRREQEKRARAKDKGITPLPRGEVLKNVDPTGGCGKGMHKGGDGQCYPNLN